ncbi:MAG: thiol:disulfide interchange protein DsbG [Paralcaligenes sp.]
MNFFKSLSAVALASALILAASQVSAQELPAPIKALQEHGLKVVGELPAVDGLKAYAGYMDQQPYALYLLPDGKHVMVGSVFDMKGNNITREPLKAAIAKPMSERTLAQLKASKWVRDGSATAPRIVYAFTDPNCPYCHKFWEQSRPWVKAGKVQIRNIVVGILTDTSPGKAAAILEASDPAKALTKNEQNFASGGIQPSKSISPKLHATLLANKALMSELGMQATPAIFYEDAEGILHSAIGAPPEANLETILGPK